MGTIIRVYPKKFDRRIPREISQGMFGFDVKHDCTDHFWFTCEKCGDRAEVKRVFRDDNYANTPTIYFYLKCPRCGITGQRKIYLEEE